MAEQHFPEYSVGKVQNDTTLYGWSVYRVESDKEGAIVATLVAVFAERDVAVNFCDTWRGRAPAAT